MTDVNQQHPAPMVNHPCTVARMKLKDCGVNEDVVRGLEAEAREFHRVLTAQGYDEERTEEVVTTFHDVWRAAVDIDGQTVVFNDANILDLREAAKGLVELRRLSGKIGRPVCEVDAPTERENRQDNLDAAEQNRLSPSIAPLVVAIVMWVVGSVGLAFTIAPSDPYLQRLTVSLISTAPAAAMVVGVAVVLSGSDARRIR